MTERCFISVNAHGEVYFRCSLARQPSLQSVAERAEANANIKGPDGRRQLGTPTLLALTMGNEASENNRESWEMKAGVKGTSRGAVTARHKRLMLDNIKPG